MRGEEEEAGRVEEGLTERVGGGGGRWEGERIHGLGFEGVELGE